MEHPGNKGARQGPNALGERGRHLPVRQLRFGERAPGCGGGRLPNRISANEAEGIALLSSCQRLPDLAQLATGVSWDLASPPHDPYLIENKRATQFIGDPEKPPAKWLLWLPTFRHHAGEGLPLFRFLKHRVWCNQAGFLEGA